MLIKRNKIHNLFMRYHFYDMKIIDAVSNMDIINSNWLSCCENGTNSRKKINQFPMINLFDLFLYAKQKMSSGEYFKILEKPFKKTKYKLNH